MVCAYLHDLYMLLTFYRSKPQAHLEKHAEDGDDDFADEASIDGDEPTAEDLALLRRVPDKLPWSAFLVAIVELCERFAYYGLSGPFQNYMSNEW